MKTVKSKEEIELMKTAGLISAKALKKVREAIKPGISGLELDQIANSEIKKLGGTPSFVTVEDYQWTICTSINDQVVHGIPTERTVESGDIIGIDIGALYKGYHSDLAITVPVGTISKETQKFLDVGSKTLQKAIAMAKAGNHIGDISQTIQQGVESEGYSIVKSLSGHGVGIELHEDPMIPGFGKAGTGPKIQKNMTLAIEIIYTQKSPEVFLEEDNWTISTKDASLSGLFEQTIATTNNGPIVLTPYL